MNTGEDKNSAPDRLKDFGARLEKTLDAQRAKAKVETTEGAAAGLAMRVIIELVVAVAVCMGIGWIADRYFGTAPWIMLAMMPLGFAAGVVNVMRLSKTKQADEVLGGKGPVPPSVKDDEDED
jgi:ATP synthase protein I